MLLNLFQFSRRKVKSFKSKGRHVFDYQYKESTLKIVACLNSNLIIEFDKINQPFPNYLAFCKIDIKIEIAGEFQENPSRFGKVIQIFKSNYLNLALTKKLFYRCFKFINLTAINRTSKQSGILYDQYKIEIHVAVALNENPS